MKDFKGYYQKVQKAPIDKFYIKLLENINIFIPVPKGTYKEPTEKKEEEKLYREKTRWMVLRTFNEETHSDCKEIGSYEEEANRSIQEIWKEGS